MSYLSCDGVVELADGPDTNIDRFTCSTGWVVRYDADMTFDPASDIDPVMLAGAVGAGFFFLVPLWVALLGGRILMKAIRG